MDMFIARRPFTPKVAGRYVLLTQFQDGLAAYAQ